MKKLLYAAIVVFGLAISNAQQVEFGATGGLLSVRASAEFEGNSASDSETGFYVGGVVDFSISEKFHIQPELVYANVNGGNGLILPIMAKYYVSNGFNIQAGPQLDFSLEEVPDDFTGTGISLAGGLGYDIDDNFFIEARYSFQLNDYYTGNLDVETSSNFLMVGVGYKFN